MLRDAFGNRVLRFDSEAARARGMAVATRNVRHFEGIDMMVGDPWTAA